jgi:hypothetical protein
VILEIETLTLELQNPDQNSITSQHWFGLWTPKPKMAQSFPHHSPSSLGGAFQFSTHQFFK